MSSSTSNGNTNTSASGRTRPSPLRNVLYCASQDDTQAQDASAIVQEDGWEVLDEEIVKVAEREYNKEDWVVVVKTRSDKKDK